MEDLTYSCFLFSLNFPFFIPLIQFFPFTGITGKNNRFPFLDILGYLKNTHKNPKFVKSETSPNQGTWLGIPWLGLVSLC